MKSAAEIATADIIDPDRYATLGYPHEFVSIDRVRSQLYGETVDAVDNHHRH